VLIQKYRLNLDRGLTEFLSVAVGGTLEDDRAWTLADGISSEQHARSSTLYGRLTLGTPVLGVNLGADRREQATLSRVTTSYITDTYGLDANWRPLDLPELQFRLSHQDSYDNDRTLRDISSDTASLGARFKLRNLDTRYLVGWLRSDDRLHGVETTSIEQNVLASEADTFFDGRTSTYLSGTFQTRNFTTVATAPGGIVTQQQVPDLGLSAVVVLPATSDNIALTPNQPIIDGNTTAGAGVNVGYGLATVNDLNPREVGARFVDAVTDVNQILVWFDRPLTSDVARLLAGSMQVRASIDNQRWTVVPLAGTAVLSPVDNRIEIPIVQTHARYLKVTIQPLPLGATTDTTYRDVFVSEAQFMLLLPAAAVPHNSHSMYASATATARTLFRKAPDVSWDVAGTVGRQVDPDRTTYSLVNGISTLHKPLSWLYTQARVARLDSYDGVLHIGQFQWSVGAAGTPIPAAAVSATYSGVSYDSGRLDNIGTLYGRADWYQGVSSQATTSAAFSTQGLRLSRTLSATGSTTLTPNAYVTVTGGALYSYQWMSDPDLGTSWSQFLRADGSVTITPAPTVTGSGTVSRVVIGVNPTTFATGNLSYSPLRGDVQLSLAYSKNLDTFSQTTNELFSAALRWNIRRGVLWTTSYSIAGTSAPKLTSGSRSILTTLQIIF
jgi:hypothetical protein